MTWTPTDIAISDWGHLRVTVDGKDVTFFRDMLTIVSGWQDTDPYSSNNASLLFPQITEFDDLDGDPALAWFAEGKPVRFDRVNDGAVVSNLFDGIIDRIEAGSDAVTATCAGNLAGRLALRMHQPSIQRDTTMDVGAALFAASGAGTINHYDMTPGHGIVTGIEIDARGSRDMTRLGFMDHVLGMAIKPNGDSLTVLQDPEDRKTYVQQWRSMATVDATVDAGAHGVKVRLSKDLVDSPNKIFAEWVTPEGERCRNAVYPNLGEKNVPDYPFTDGRAFGLGTTNADTDSGSGITIMARELISSNLLRQGDWMEGRGEYDDDVVDAVEELQREAGLTVTGEMDPQSWAVLYSDGFEQQSFRQAHFRAVAQATETRYFLSGPDGTPYDINPAFDSSIPPVEQFISYGEGMRSKRVRRNARAIIRRNGGRAGTVTLTSDPAEMSRFDLRAGMTLNVRYLLGTGATGLKLYISSVQVDWASGSQSVTLAVSTTARHYMDLATRKQRNREANQDPAKRWAHQLRRSARTSDTVIGWEGESGAGTVPVTDLTAGTWNVIPVVACEYGTMSNIELQVDAPTTFYAALFADRVFSGVLDRRIGDPSVWVNEEDQVDVFMANSDWLVEDERLLIEYWGTPDQPCGLWPKPYLNKNGERSSAPINGKHRDDSSWTFGTKRNFLWLAVWAAADTTISGRMRIVLGDG